MTRHRTAQVQSAEPFPSGIGLLFNTRGAFVINCGFVASFLCFF